MPAPEALAALTGRLRRDPLDAADFVPEALPFACSSSLPTADVESNRLWRRNWGQITLSLVEDAGAADDPPAVMALGASSSCAVVAPAVHAFRAFRAFPADAAAPRARAPPQRVPCRRDGASAVPLLPVPDLEEGALALPIAVAASSQPFLPPWEKAEASIV